MSGRFRARCTYCRRVMEPPSSKSRVAATRDHITPQSNGGTITVPCCRQCNGMKGNMSPQAWARFMARNPEWWRTKDCGPVMRP